MAIDRSIFTVTTSNGDLIFPKDRYRWEVMGGGALYVVPRNIPAEDDRFHLFATGEWSHVTEG